MCTVSSFLKTIGVQAARRRPVTAALIAAFLLPAGHAVAQTITVTPADSSAYTFDLPKMYKPKLNGDGTVTLRIGMTRYYDVLPGGYSKVDVTPTDLQKSYLGSDLGSKTRDIRIIFDANSKSDALVLTDADGARKTITEKDLTKQEELRYSIYKELRKDQSSEGLDNLISSALSVSPPYTVINENYLFGYGDVVTNGRSARTLAWDGTSEFDDEHLTAELDSLASYVKVLKDPNSIENASAATESLDLDSLKSCGRWSFNVFKIQATPLIVNTSQDYDYLGQYKMFQVSVRWVFEVTYNPANPPNFGPATAAYQAASAASNVADATPAASAAPGSTQQANTTTSGSTPNLSGLTTLGFGGSDLPSSLPSLTNVDYVGGFAVLNNGWTRVVGVNAYNSSGTGSEFSQPIFDISLRNLFVHPSKLINSQRIGLIAGVTDGGGTQSVLLAPDIRLNKYVSLFGGFSVLGGAFSNANGGTRQSLAFGATLALNDLLNGSTGKSTAPAAPKAPTISIKGGDNLAPTGAAKVQDAAIVWTCDTPNTIDPKLTVPPAGVAVKPSGPFSYYLLVTADSNGVQTTTLFTFENGKRIYITYVKPGALVDVIEVDDDGTGKLTKKRWGVTTNGIGISESVTHTPVTYEAQGGGMPSKRYSFDAGKTYQLTIAP